MPEESKLKDKLLYGRDAKPITFFHQIFAIPTILIFSWGFLLGILFWPIIRGFSLGLAEMDEFWDYDDDNGRRN
jgi:hypothetical protein